MAGEKTESRFARLNEVRPIQRFGLLLFGALLAALFLALTIAEGIGAPSIPKGDVILVENTPGDVGHIDKAAIKSAIEITSAREGAQEPPKPGTPVYEQTKESAEETLLEAVWIQGLADEWDIKVSEGKVEAEFQSVKESSEYEKFLRKSHYTPASIRQRLKVQFLAAKVQEEIQKKAPQPSQSEIEDYYEIEKTAQFNQKPTRDIRQVVNLDRKKAQEAYEALSKDNSAVSWKRVAEKYSEDPVTKENGGLQRDVREEVGEELLMKTVFGAPEGELEGPLKTERGYVVFEVISSTPEGPQDLKIVEGMIRTTLAQQLEQEYSDKYISQFMTEWTARTQCADGYVIERCANYKGSGHPTSASQACYEADPEGGVPEACPAPVTQAKPALPGSITPLKREGEPLAQRPHPPGAESAKSGAPSP